MTKNIVNIKNPLIVLIIIYFFLILFACIYHSKLDDYSNGLYGSMYIDKNINADNLYWYCIIIVPSLINLSGIFSAHFSFIQHLENKISSKMQTLYTRFLRCIGKTKHNTYNHITKYTSIILIIYCFYLILTLIISMWYIHPTIFDLYYATPLFCIALFLYNIFGAFGYIILVLLYALLPYSSGRCLGKYVSTHTRKV